MGYNISPLQKLLNNERLHLFNINLMDWNIMLKLSGHNNFSNSLVLNLVEYKQCCMKPLDMHKLILAIYDVELS
ncbi:hypothetical protein DERF_008980 [Dermatophagoides farinae]|uniref:Uncharacterized protein n=1 Tax=Dermatophagoides farinae TaxID=6954 RepID=A0A922HVT8_DERFA|nr:hypothetical protein DERF_008980 [Dermatophagoides farinae]